MNDIKISLGLPDRVFQLVFVPSGGSSKIIDRVTQSIDDTWGTVRGIAKVFIVFGMCVQGFLFLSTVCVLILQAVIVYPG